MSKKALTEKQVLRKLNIANFKELPDTKLNAFTHLLPKMDPEVAKKALEQIPEFTKSAVQIANYNKELFAKGLDGNDASATNVYNICNNIVQIYEKRLNESVSDSERNECIKNLLEIAKISRDVNKAHQNTTLKILLICAISAIVLMFLPVIVIILIVGLFFLPVAALILAGIIFNRNNSSSQS